MQYQQQVQARQQLVQQQAQAQAAQSQAAQQPQQQPHPQTDSNALTDILKGTWKALTEGGAAAVEAGGKAWDEKDKVMDGAELGFKMAGPVVEYAAKEAGKDAVVSLVSSLWGKYLPSEINGALNIYSSPEYQMYEQITGAQKDAQNIAGRINHIAEGHQGQKE